MQARGTAAAAMHSLAAHVGSDDLVNNNALAGDGLLAQRTHQPGRLVHTQHRGNGGDDELQADE